MTVEANNSQDLTSKKPNTKQGCWLKQRMPKWEFKPQCRQKKKKEESYTLPSNCYQVISVGSLGITIV
jgi:hypothetical protein